MELATKSKSKAQRILDQLERRKPDPKLKERIYTVLKREFPADTVDVSDGYRDNIHVLVVSRGFDKCRSEQEKEEMLFDMLIEKGSFTEDELAKITMLLPYSPDELK
jgi:polyhydroxyalkanoate synthesis regulator phasin